MNRLLYLWLDRLAKRTGGFRLYLVLVDVIIMGLVMSFAKTFLEDSSALKTIVVAVALVSAIGFFGLIIGSFFDKPKIAVVFLYLLLVISIALIVVLSCTYTYFGAPGEWITEMFGKKIYW